MFTSPWCRVTDNNGNHGLPLLMMSGRKYCFHNFLSELEQYFPKLAKVFFITTFPKVNDGRIFQTGQSPALYYKNKFE